MIRRDPRFEKTRAPRVSPPPSQNEDWMPTIPSTEIHPAILLARQEEEQREMERLEAETRLMLEREAALRAEQQALFQAQNQTKK